ncbi:hypothetical protein P8605_39730, partial [Streptomyces sp. T-3]|nr:hypothetical protein [Streptomyces sp. T-3]
LAAGLGRAGVPVELWTVSGADHGWYGVSDARVEEVFTRSLAFARRMVARPRTGRRPGDAPSG